MNDRTLRDTYDLLMARRANESHGGTDCPPPDALVALVERRGTEADRLATLDRVMACADCRADLELLRSVHAAATAEGAAAGEPRARRPVPLAAAAAIALVAAGTVLWIAISGDDSQDVLRGDDGTVMLVSPPPEAAADSPAVLVWRSVADAAIYDVEVLDAGGESVFRTQTRDTLVAAPLAGGSYQWWVHARMPDGAVTRSDLRQLRVGR